MNSEKLIKIVSRVAFSFEVIIAFIILIVVAINVIELVFGLYSFELIVIPLDFEDLLYAMLALVIGIEFTKMLCKQTPESVIDVLLFAIARQLVIYQKSTIDLLVGIVAIALLFAARAFFVTGTFWKKKNQYKA